MSNDRRRATRRRFLTGVGGVMVGLPFLEGLAPRLSRGAPVPGIQRFGVFFCCNGVNMNQWFPNGAYGTLTDAHLMGTTAEALLPFRDKLLYPRGLHMAPRGFARDPGGGDDHGKGMAHKLTAYNAEEEDWLALGPSVDHVIAAQVNPGGRPPFNLMVGRRGRYRSLDFISYSGAAQAVAAINNPWAAFSEFINLGSGDDSEAARQALFNQRKSVLDLVQDQFDDLKRRPLSRDDVQKLDQHFAAIRELEITAGSGIACADPDIERRASVYSEDSEGELVTEEGQYPAITDLQIDIMALALACDHTRVATMHFDRGAAGPIFRWDGMQHEYSHHKLSHGKVRDDCFGDSTEDGCADVDGYEAMLTEIDRWHMSKLARLLERLESYVEEDGRTVLENSVIMYTNELSDGKDHSFMDLPYLLAGSAGGVLRQNAYVPLGPEGYDDEAAPHNKLLNTIVNVMGIESDWFGLPEGEGGETMQGGVYEELLA